MLVRVAGLEAADYGLLGSEFPADDRPVPARGWWTRCTDDQGRLTSIYPSCDFDECRASDLTIKRIDADGNSFEPDLRPNDEPAVMAGFRVSCMATGEFIVQWQDATTRCFLHRIYDGDGHALSGATQTISDDASCGVRGAVALDPSGGLVAVWAEELGGGRTRIQGRRFLSGDVAEGDVFEISDESRTGPSPSPKVAIDPSGVTLVTWIDEQGRETPDPIYAVFFDRRGRPASEILRVNSFAYGTVAAPVVDWESPGVFVVLWSNRLQGGRVGRRVGVLGEGTSPTTTTTTVTLPEHMPRLGAARVLTSTILSLSESAEPSVDAGGEQVWFLVGADGEARRTTSDGRFWEPPAAGLTVGLRTLAQASDRAGVWVALQALEHHGGLEVTRSVDDAFRWTASSAIADVSPDCPDCLVARAAVAGAAGGPWVAAWSVRTSTSTEIRAARSTDGGQHWGASRPIAADAGLGQAGFALASDEHGVLVLMWADSDLWTTRSADGGQRWSPATRIARGIVCASCSSHQRYDRLELVTDGAGGWLATFAAPAYETALYGNDADVFVVRSNDGGQTWTPPTPVAGYFERDGARDFDPTVAVDTSEGVARYVVAWTSHQPRSGAADMDGDVVAVVSVDGGASWSAPMALNEGAGADLAHDSSPKLRVSAAGVWMLTWKQESFVPGVDAIAARTLVAVGDAACGDAAVDVAEQCDDGNRSDDDGCDSNCTRTMCGNGVPTNAEECDDANAADQDLCRLDCRLAVCGDGITSFLVEECDDGNRRNDDDCTNRCREARCGDGFKHRDVEECDDANADDTDECTGLCRWPRCGDGIVQDSEQCDDGNEDELDLCLGDCTNAPPRCGDGQMDEGEQCDDGNDEETDRCRNDCTQAPPRCGDGHRDAAEQCDDGNVSNGDYCVEGCKAAYCGDGFINHATEVCDWGASNQTDLCGPTCGVVDVCGDANADGRTTAADAQIILRHSVGLRAVCPTAACDMDASGSVVVTDAQMAITKAVGIEVGERCSLGTGWIVFWTDYASGPIAALSFDVEYGLTGGDFRGSYDQVICQSLLASMGSGTIPSAFNDVDEAGVLHAAMISLDGFVGPTDLVRCWFDLPEGTTGARFVLRTTDATDPYFVPIQDLYVGYRLQQ